MPLTESPQEPIEGLLAKYEQERSKRLKEEGVKQYIDVRSEAIQALAKDPWVKYDDPRVQNPPLKDGDRIKFLITGAGINGIEFAGRLVNAGISNRDIVCVDVAGGWGGTWYYNRYPGVMCDVEGYCYVPFLEETGYMPRHKYSYGHEIRGQIERSADHFGIKGQFCTKIDSQIWDETKKLWVVTMTRTVGQPSISTEFTVYADFVLISGAPFILPKMPVLPGWNDIYQNKRVFHSARWDYEYTGGTPEKPDLVNLRGKRVAIVGTGATAIQIVPELAKWAERVYVVQRTPTHVGERGQVETDPEAWAKITSEKGWQKKRRMVFDAYVSYSKANGPDIINDGWTNTPAGSGFLGSNSKIVAQDQIEQHIREMHVLDMPRTNLLRKRVDEIVENKDTAEKLKAWYGSWCKRPSFHDEYLQAFNKPNVTLIDTDGRGLDGYTKNGIVFDGHEYEVDCLVLATGFTFSHFDSPAEKLRTKIQGRNGVTLTDYWKNPESGTIFGMAMPNFPNFFSFLTHGGGATWNLTSSLDMNANLIGAIITQAQQRAGKGNRFVIEPSVDGERQYALELAKRVGWFSVMPVCTPGYFNAEGAAAFKKKEEKTKEQIINEGRKMPWGTGPVDFRSMIENFVAKGDLEGFMVEAVA